MENNTADVSMTAIIAIALVTVILGGCHLYTATEREAIKAGLHQKVVPGTETKSVTTIWTKE